MQIPMLTGDEDKDAESVRLYKQRAAEWVAGKDIPEHVKRAIAAGWTGVTGEGAPWWYGYPPVGVCSSAIVRDGSGRCVLPEDE